MADLEFSRHDLVSLIEKVSTLQPDFSPPELQLLMSIFALAAEHTAPADVRREPPEEPDPTTVEELKEQLLKAYTPHSSLHSATGSGAGEAAKLHIHVSSGIHR